MITRFAPSPTGPLHLGHAYSALLAHDLAMAAGGEFLLRIEDTDLERCRPEWEELIAEDLHWLGLNWPEPVLRQSEHIERYNRDLARLEDMDLLYPCSCTRADIRAAQAAPQEGVAYDVYPGTCRGRSMASRQPGDALRLDMARAISAVDPRSVTFSETGSAHLGQHQLNPARITAHVGDVVLSRKGVDIVAYFLASTLDDAYENITHVIRGEDLFGFTMLQVLLLTLLDLPVPTYHHHKLIRDEGGKRLAKRDDARAISKFRAEGASPADIRHMVGL